jgi:hypothetical protein
LGKASSITVIKKAALTLVESHFEANRTFVEPEFGKTDFRRRIHFQANTDFGRMEFLPRAILRTTISCTRWLAISFALHIPDMC